MSNRWVSLAAIATSRRVVANWAWIARRSPKVSVRFENTRLRRSAEVGAAAMVGPAASEGAVPIEAIALAPRRRLRWITLERPRDQRPRQGWAPPCGLAA